MGPIAGSAAKRQNSPEQMSFYFNIRMNWGHFGAENRHFSRFPGFSTPILAQTLTLLFLGMD
jgi:hypothetical protein